MQCVPRRWSIWTIGYNAAESKIALAVLRQRICAQPSRTFVSVHARLSDRGVEASTSPKSKASDEGGGTIPRVTSASRSSRSKRKSKRSVAKDDKETAEREPEQWYIQKAALKEKFGADHWNPRKKLSPDTIEGIRAMHASDPERFTTPVLAENFKVSPEAIRRILKSKWQPSPEDQESRRQRWERRGERVWSHLAEMGVKPPKPWRVRGVGKASLGEMPTWKGRSIGRVGASVRSSGEATTVRRGLVAAKASSAASATGFGVGKKISDRIL